MGTIQTAAAKIPPGNLSAYGALPANTQGIATLSNGTYVTVVKTGASTSQLRILTSTNKGTSWTAGSTFNAPVAIKSHTLGQFADGSLALVALANDATTLRYAKITVNTWAVSAWETIATTTSVNPLSDQYDVDVSDAGAVGVAYLYQQSNQLYYCMSHRLAGSASWTQPVKSLASSTQNRQKVSESIAILALSLQGGGRDWVIALSAAVKPSSGNGNAWVRRYSARITEATGAINGPFNKLKDVTVFYAFDPAVTSLPSAIRLVRDGSTHYVMMSAMSYKSPGNYPAVYTYVSRQSLLAQVETIDWERYSQIPTFVLQYYKVSAFSFGWHPDGHAIIRYQVNADSGVRSQVFQNAGLSSYKVYDGIIEIQGIEDPSSMSHSPTKNLTPEVPWATQRYTSSTSTTRSHIAEVQNPSGQSAVSIRRPSEGATDQVATPDLVSWVNIGTDASTSAYLVEYQFAQDPAFTSSVVNYRPGSSGYKVLPRHVPSKDHIFIDKLPSIYSLSKAVWYARARLVNLFGQTGLWSNTLTFTVGHPPRAIPISPVGNNLYVLPSGGSMDYSWQFTDPSEGDYQTAYQLILYDFDLTQIFDSGKIVSSNKFHTHVTQAALKDTLVFWRANTWDVDDTFGAGDLAGFVPTDPTLVTLAMAPGTVLSTGVPTILFTPTTGGDRRIREASISIMQGPNIIWSKRSVLDVASGVQQGIRIDNGVIFNNQSYSVQVTVTDSSGMIGSSAIVPFSASWIPPTTPSDVAADLEAYNDEARGYMEVSWSDLGRDADFTNWTIYRKDDLMSDDRVDVVVEGEWTKIGESFIESSLYIFRDYFAPSGHRVTYGVVQTADRDGHILSSEMGVSDPIYPASDGYWLIEASGTVVAEAFKISLVIADSFEDEQEEAEFTVIGRGRVFNKGQRLGRRGTLDVQLRHTGGTTARQKRLRLLDLQSRVRQLYLRDPFGDMFRVNTSSMSVSRIAGVGNSEFCDVSIPYAEVAQ